MTLEELFTFENLNNAFYETARISQWKESTQRYKANLLVNNIQLQEDLLNGKYSVSKTTDFKLNERGKIRNIEAPAIRDRIVQKILCQKILIPELSKPLIYDNYASLKHRGTTFARRRLDFLLQRHIRKCGSDGYVLKIDIKKYFESIDHKILKEMIRNRIKESSEVMDLIDYMIDTSSHKETGLNLGSEAPQIFAIFYLSPIDTYIKTVKAVKYYGRYMDDMFIISNNKDELKELLDGVIEQLSKLKLCVNESKTQITKLSHGFTYLQIKYSVDDRKIIKRPTRNKITRERRRLKKYKKLCDAGRMDENKIYNCYKSWRNGIMKDCNKCYKTILSMDRLYKELFPEHLKKKKLGRNELIMEAYREYKEEYGKCLKNGNYRIIEVVDTIVN